MKIKYDKIADAAYMYLKKGKIDKSVEVSDRVIIDVDKKGNILGVEMLDYSSQQDIKKFEKTAKEGIPVEITNNTPATA